MNKISLLSTLVSTVSAALSWVLIALLLEKRMEWQSFLAFIAVFAVVFNITSVLFRGKRK